MRLRILTSLVAAGLAGAAGICLGGERATVTGSLADAAGHPVEHATVMVYKAGVKKGYSVYCPTCWADCGKHSATDAEGHFTIGGLSPDLVFTLLVVREGYAAEYVSNVDPAKGPAEKAVLKPRPPVSDASQIVRGLVVDGRGRPLRDAVVEQQGEDPLFKRADGTKLRPRRLDRHDGGD
jgi:protocatechuate 3,4-dioxygenase beta subunit